MIVTHPAIRFVLRIFGLADAQRDFNESRGPGTAQGDCPFVLVGRDPSGRWGVFQQDFDTPLVSFDGMAEACDYANEIAKTRANTLILIGRRQGTPPSFPSVAKRP